MKCRKCQSLFSGKKNKKTIVNLSSTELAQRVVKVNCVKKQKKTKKKPEIKIYHDLKRCIQANEDMKKKK